jgi:Protein of unknown function (DUF1501)
MGAAIMNKLREHDLTRRAMLKMAAAGVMGGTAVNWFETLAAHAAPASAAAQPARARSCILLWLAGGLSQTDTFDMKPDASSDYRGEFKPINTNVPGISVCDLLPRLAKHADKLALLRSMSTSEADHARGTYFMQTGYRMLPGTYHPHLGSIVSAELGRPDFELPNFFWLGGATSASGGFLGARHNLVHIPHVQNEGSRNLELVRPALPMPAFDRRAALLDKLEASFEREHHGLRPIVDHRAAYQAAQRLMRSSKLKAFDLKNEPDKARAAYGDAPFGKGCLLARRLVEVGVPFVGVSLGDFDTHNNNWKRLRPLLPVVDQGMSALLTDLTERGLLDSTLVICMGEFGRDPKINSKKADNGREHYARAWTAVVGGGGLKTGQVVGRTSKTGQEVEERPIRTADFMATVCQALGIDFTKENKTPDGRPIRLADKGARVVEELFR